LAGTFPNIKLIGGRWYVYIAVPRDAQSAIGKKSFTQSLGTGDLQDAKKLAPPIIKKIKIEIANARKKTAVASLDLQPARIALANWATKGGLKKTIPDDWYDPARLEKLKTAATTENGWQDLPDFNLTVAQMLEFGGLSVGSKDAIVEGIRREAAFHLWLGEQDRERTRQIAKLESERVAAIDKLSSIRRADLTEIGPTYASLPTPPPPAMKISELYAAWLTSIKNPSQKERGRFDHYVRRITETLGDKPINYVSKAEVQELMDLVARMPGRKRSADLDKLPLREMVAKFEKENAKRVQKGVEPIETLTATSVAVWFSNYNRMFEYVSTAEQNQAIGAE
jgi:hypothetical protein